MFCWCSVGVLVVFWRCSGGVQVFGWCFGWCSSGVLGCSGGVLVVFWWYSGGVLVF